MRRGLLLLLGWVSLLPLSPLGAEAGPRPSADDIIARFLERCRTTPERLAAQHHACVRRTVREELGSDGQVKERKTKEHTVELHGEEQRVRLLKLGERAPTDGEHDRERAKETEERRRFAERKDKARERGPDFVDEKLVRRFRYEFAGTEPVDGRPTHVLKFTAVPGRTAKDTSDRALDLLVGRIWIDAEESELVKVDARLKEPLSILGGIVATVDRLDFTIERRRQPDGFWFNTALGSYAEGRKLFSGFRVRSRIEQDGFHRLPEP